MAEEVVLSVSELFSTTSATGGRVKFLFSCVNLNGVNSATILSKNRTIVLVFVPIDATY